MNEKYFEGLSNAYLAHFCRRLADLIIEQGSEMLDEMGLKTPTTAISAVLFLADRQNVTVASMADELGISHQMGTQRVKQLEKLGLITRISSSSDKRSKQIVLTDLGQTEAALLLPFTKKFTQVFESINHEVGCDLSKAVRQAELSLLKTPLKKRLDHHSK